MAVFKTPKLPKIYFTETWVAEKFLDVHTLVQIGKKVKMYKTKCGKMKNSLLQINKYFSWNQFA